MSDGATLFATTRTYDAVGNVATVSTTLSTGTDNQAFCYDEQHRLTWASSASGTIPCGGTNTAGTLTAAQYTQSFGYDNLGRLTSGALGSYTYGDSAHLHAATAVGSGYTASYDAAGNMLCRAPTSSTTCAGTQTGAQLSFDNEGRLAAWQNAPGSGPSSTDAFLYDGEGHRVEQQSTQSGVTSTTIYVGNLEDISTTGSGTPTTTTYYYAGSLRIAEAVNGAVSYLETNALGSVSLAVDANGNVQASTLYAPYGTVRYSSGTMPTARGFTGQYADATSGLDYYGARYYDPVLGQFTSADTVQGLNRYAYVADDPETLTDPTGHVSCLDPPCDGSGRNYGGGSGGGDEPNWDYATMPTPRPNARQSFLDTGYDDYFNVGGKFTDLKGSTNGPDDPTEIADGTVLAHYFRCHVDRIQTEGSQPTADYDVYVQQEYAMPFIDPVVMQSQHARVELYVPTTTNWDDPRSSYGGGIVRKAMDKGQQASIIVIDISKIDLKGQLGGPMLEDYADRIMYAPYQKAKPSMVGRVIFIRNGAVVGDWSYNAEGYGPPVYPPNVVAPLRN